jgi:hypothetical protein
MLTVPKPPRSTRQGPVTWRDGGGVQSASGSTILSNLPPVLPNRAAAGADPIETETAPEGAQLKVNMALFACRG